jgi:hypothetical protein
MDEKLDELTTVMIMTSKRFILLQTVIKIMNLSADDMLMIHEETMKLESLKKQFDVLYVDMPTNVDGLLSLMKDVNESLDELIDKLQHINRIAALNNGIILP